MGGPQDRVRLTKRYFRAEDADEALGPRARRAVAEGERAEQPAPEGGEAGGAPDEKPRRTAARAASAGG
eukprot:2437710-Pyramimonas_sp.AAC.1